MVAVGSAVERDDVEWAEWVAKTVCRSICSTRPNLLATDSMFARANACKVFTRRREDDLGDALTAAFNALRWLNLSTDEGIGLDVTIEPLACVENRQRYLLTLTVGEPA